MVAGCQKKGGHQAIDPVRRAACPAWPAVRYVELSAAGKAQPKDVIHLRQVEAIDSNGVNQALAANGGTAWQASCHMDGRGADKLIDGEFESSNHTAHGKDSTTRITLKHPTDVHELVIHNARWSERWQSSERIAGSVVRLLGENRSVIWSHTFSKAVDPGLFQADDPEPSSFSERFTAPPALPLRRHERRCGIERIPAP